MSSIPLILPDANPHERLLFADEEEEDDITDVDGTTATATATAAAATLQTRPKYSKPPRRHASLLSRDIALSAVLAVQLAAFVHVMAGRWTFPETWLRRLRWLNLLALDPWQFGRLQTTGAYVSVAGGETDSSLAPFSYRYILAGWLAVYALLVGGYALGVYLAGLDCHPDTARRVAIVRRVVYLVVQVVAFPSAIAVARLLHCRTDGTVDTMNQLSCYAAEHWCYIGVGVAVVLAVQFTVAWRMRVDARHNLRGDTDSRRRHERLLRQKALEYENAVDMSWCTDGYEWFASFGHRAALTRPLTLVAGVLVATVYSFCFDEQFVEATLLASSFALVLVICLLSPPYRVSLCNWLLCSTLSSCMVTCVLGSLITGSATGTNVWLQPDYLQRLLATVYGFQVALWLLVFAYLTVRLCLRRRRRRRMSSSRRGVKSKRWLCCGEMVKSVAAKPDSSLWPADNPKPMHRKYVYDIKRARNLIDKVQSTPALFAPAHLLDMHIHIVNADCRLAERDHDAMHPVLWQLLDNLISVHSKVAPKSLFAASIKDSIRKTTNDLLVQLPAFSRRLAQREYFLLFASKTKRRILLKMYTISVFMKHKKQTIRRDNLTFAAIDRVWKPPQVNEYGLEDFTTLYPAREVTGRDLLLPNRDVTRTPLVAIDDAMATAADDDLDRDARNLDTTARWLREHSPAHARNGRIQSRGRKIAAAAEQETSMAALQTNATSSTFDPAAGSTETSDSETLPPPSYRSQQPTSTESSGETSDDSTEDSTSEASNEISGQSGEPTTENSKRLDDSSSGEDTPTHQTSDHETTPTLKELTNDINHDSTGN